MLPVSIKVVNKELLAVEWNDGSISKIKLPNLRLNCPCAFCASDRESKGKKYFPIYSTDELTVTNISTIGNYAVGISWKDGHNTGIYSFQYLKKISIR
ncbi:MAG: DUF971 domain-containing protein [Bacteroidota bacterium]|jgi:DUF971 family protein